MPRALIAIISTYFQIILMIERCINLKCEIFRQKDNLKKKKS